MGRAGQVTALDNSEKWTAVARRYWQEAGVDDRVELVLGKPADSHRAAFEQRVARGVDSLETSIEIRSVEHQRIARREVAETLGVLAEGDLAPRLDILEDPRRDVGDGRIGRLPAGVSDELGDRHFRERGARRVRHRKRRSVQARLGGPRRIVTRRRCLGLAWPTSSNGPSPTLEGSDVPLQ